MENAEDSSIYNCLLDSLTAFAENRRQRFQYANFLKEYLNISAHFCGKLMSTSRAICELKLFSLWEIEAII